MEHIPGREQPKSNEVIEEIVLISEEEYISKSVAYALSQGRVQEKVEYKKTKKIYLLKNI
jgi:hypothetical protein